MRVKGTSWSRLLVAFSAWMVGAITALPAFCDDQPVQKSIDPAELRIAVSRAERALMNVRVKFAMQAEKLDPQTHQWRPDGKAGGTAWYVGVPRSKVKIEFDDWISPWLDGSAPFFEKRFTIAFDGKFGLELDKTEGIPGHLHNAFLGRITADRTPVFDEFSSTFTGWGFSLYGVLDQIGERLSDTIGKVRPEGVKATVYARTVVAQTPCVEITLYNLAGGGDIFDLDPARNYALMRHEHFYKSGVTVERLVVSSFIEAAPGVFFPREGKLERASNPALKAGTTSFRETFSSTDAVANDPSFTGDAFEIKWPTGSRIDDTITGGSYTVEPSDSELDRLLQKEVDDAIKSATTAPSSP
jgi:hypothetical protein